MSLRPVRTSVAVEAADWFAANREGLDAEQRKRFVLWLQSSAAHVEEYLTVTRLAGELRAARGSSPVSLEALLAAARAADESMVQPPQHPLRLRRAAPRHWQYAAAAAAVTALALGLVWLSMPSTPPAPAAASLQRFSTRHGEQRSEPLSDGSLLSLDTDTAVAVRYEPTQRLVTLERGQAVFAVAHDPARPFRVLAGPAEVIAVGTRFDVYLKGGTALVTVTEGRVTVDNITPPGVARPAARTPVQVGAGQMVRVESGQPPSGPLPIDATRATAWLHRQISFEAAPLGDVAAEFNRYAAVPVEIETPALRSVAVSGVFSVDDTESFVAFLRSLDGVGVEVTATAIRVFKK